MTFNTIEHPSDRVVFAVYTKLISHDGSPLSRVPISGIVTPRKHFLLDCEQSLFFAKLLHAKPNHASGEAACREKRGRKPEKKKLETADSFVLSGDNKSCQGNLITKEKG